MSDITFDTGAMRAGARAMGDAATGMQSDLDALLGDQPQWGADGISALCQMVYQAIVDVVTDSGGGVNQAWADHDERLRAAARMYDDTEATAIEIAQWKA